MTMAPPRLVVLLLLLFVLGCGLDESPRPRRVEAPPPAEAPLTVPTWRATTGGASATRPATVPAEPAEPATAARAEIEQRLQAGDWDGLSARLAPLVTVVSLMDSSNQRPIDPPHALAWLRERWQPGVQVVDASEVEHYRLLELRTQPWRPVPPSGETVQLNAHRYNGSGLIGDEGQWLIDTILYE